MIRSASPFKFLHAHSLVQIGYPPPDVNLRSWLLSDEEISDETQDTIRRKLHGFVYALLTVTRTALDAVDSNNEKYKIPETEYDVEFRQAKLASAFRLRMTEGLSFQGQNAYRKGLYKKVIQSADEVSFRGFSHSGEDDRLSKFMEGIQQTTGNDLNEPEEYHPYVSKDGKGVEDAGKLLTEFVDPRNLLNRDKGRPRRPLVIFAFDEAHVLTDNPRITNTITKWNLFSELRRILRQTSNQAIFSLFLSTAGRFHLFSPEIRSDPSRRIQNSSLSTLDPITEISFDDLAYDAPKDEIMLDRVVEMDWMCHLGRPLYVLFGYPFSEQLTSHLDQVRVPL